MTKLIERIAQFLTEWTGRPVTNTAAAGLLIVAAVCVLMVLFACAWHKSGQIDWEAVEAERKRLEEEE